MSERPQDPPDVPAPAEQPDAPEGAASFWGGVEDDAIAPGEPGGGALDPASGRPDPADTGGQPPQGS